MLSPDAPKPVRSREHLLHLLAEASELEHNLLCSYLYAAFSLKQGLDEDLEPQELEAVGRWRTGILKVCLEEMVHLAQVANLMVAVGSRPHFDRPSLPVAPGHHPARVQVSLAPFDRATLDHFVFLERPEGSALEDAADFRAAGGYVRRAEVGVLMPSAPDYETIGEFYALLGDGLASLAAEEGDANLFIGPADCQLRPHEIGSDDLSVVTDLASAQRALHLIVLQGEGAADGTGQDSHFALFSGIRCEYDALLAARPGFRPSRDVARNPVMRRPILDDRVHVTHPPAARLLDAANALYSAMLRCLVAVYDTPSRHADRRAALLYAAISAMALVRRLSDVLTTLPARDDGGVRAGVTFATLRSTEGLAPGVDIGRVMARRFERIRDALHDLAIPVDVRRHATDRLDEVIERLLA